MNCRTWLPGLALLVSLSACAPATRVILLPQEGSPSVEVSTIAGRTVLDQPYALATVRSSGSLDSGQATAEDVEQRHGQLLAAAPEAEAQFTLLFDTGGTHITPESEAELERLLSLAQERPGADILIIGHTDRVGSDALNDELSLSRSRFVREMLIQRGFDARRIEAAGRGSRDPVVPTAEGVAEPRNRRTEVLVR